MMAQSLRCDGVADMKMFEDVLIWGTQTLSERDAESQRHPFLQTQTQKSDLCILDNSNCTSLLHGIFTFKKEGLEGDFGNELPSVKWKLRTKQDIGQSLSQQGHRSSSLNTCLLRERSSGAYGYDCPCT